MSQESSVNKPKESLAGMTSKFLNRVTIAGLMALAILFANNPKPTRFPGTPVGIKMPKNDGHRSSEDEVKGVKIGEIEINIGSSTEGEAGGTQVMISGEPNLSSQLEYIKLYFMANDKDLEVLKTNPSSRVVCEFSNRLMRNQEAKTGMMLVWSYIDEMDKSGEPEIKKINELIGGLATIFNRRNFKENISQELNKPALTGTLCSLLFNFGFNLVSKEKITEAQQIIRGILVEISNLLQRKISEGDGNAKKVAEVFRDLVFGIVPEQNR